MGVFTFRHPGSFRNLCASCGRLTAAPAILATFLLGWWGIPWGLIWTPNALLDNLESGGVTLDAWDIGQLRADEAREGSAGYLGPLAWVGGLFVLPLLTGLAVIPHLDAILGG